MNFFFILLLLRLDVVVVVAYVSTSWLDLLLRTFFSLGMAYKQLIKDTVFFLCLYIDFFDFFFFFIVLLCFLPPWFLLDFGKGGPVICNTGTENSKEHLTFKCDV